MFGLTLANCTITFVFLECVLVRVHLPMMAEWLMQLAQAYLPLSKYKLNMVPQHTWPSRKRGPGLTCTWRLTRLRAELFYSSGSRRELMQVLAPNLSWRHMMYFYEYLDHLWEIVYCNVVTWFLWQALDVVCGAQFHQNQPYAHTQAIIIVDS